MIRNERQYRMTSRQRQILTAALDELMETAAPLLTPDDVDKPSHLNLETELERASLIGQLADLDEELRQYEALREGRVGAIRINSMADLPEALIRARIGAGLTQRELADQLGLKEQQVQRYEAEGYASASLARLSEVIQALGLTFESDLQLPQKTTPLAALRRRLVGFGLDPRVVDQRLLRDAPENPGAVKLMELAERAARLIRVSVDDLINSSKPLPQLVTSARFKTATNAAERTLDAYTRYAEAIADIVFRATAHLGEPSVPGGARDVREALDERAARAVDRYSDLSAPNSDLLFRALLGYIAELGIPVIALRDPGAFHGACFTRDGRSVIILKQTATATARWLYDLLHELHHVQDSGRSELRSWIELGEIGEWNDAPEEQEANNFAADILFSGRAEPVLTQCLRAAHGRVQNLKSVISQVAEQAEVPADVLAIHLAFRLSRRGINWWSTAASFQEQATPWHYVTDTLLQQLDMQALDATDRASLLDAIAT